MADISNSIRLNDYMSSTLRTINNTMNQTIHIAMRLDRVLMTLGTGGNGGLNNLNTGLSAIMQRVQMLEALIASMGTGAGGSGAPPLQQLMSQLSAAQARIAVLEAQLAGLGNGAGNGAILQQLNAQLSAAQARIASLEAQLAGLGNGSGGASNTLIVQLNLQLRSAVTAVVQLTNALRAMGGSGGAGAARDIQRLNDELAESQRRVAELEARLQRLENAAGGAGRQFGGWALRLTGVFSALQMIQMAVMAIKNVTDTADEFTGANARLNLINDGLRTQAELQKQVLDVANNTRSSYTATAALVARMGRTNMFRGDNDTAIRFADIVNKSLNISGAGTAESSSVLIQLSQAMSSGVLRGEEFNAIMENGSRLAEALATELGVTTGGLRDMAMNGELTADVVADAILRAGEAIDEEFARMPTTFGQNAEVFRNTTGTWLAEMAKADGALGRLNDVFKSFVLWLKSDSGQTFLDGVSATLFVVVHIVELVAAGFGYLMQAIETLGPVFDGVLYSVIAIGLLYASQLLWAFGADIAKTIPKILSMGAAWMLAHAPIVLIGAAIGALVAALLYFGFTANDILTFVGGLFGGFIALIGNIVILFINLFITAAEFIANVFNDPVFAVQLLFYNMVDAILGFFNGLLGGIKDGLNWIIDKVNDVTGLKFGNVGEWVLNNPLTKPTSEKQIVENDRVEYLSYNDLAAKGADFAAGFLKGTGGEGTSGMDGMSGLTDIGNVDKVGKVGKIDSDVNIADEDMKMLMELAVQNRVNQINLTVQTAAPNVTQNNIVNNKMDLQAVANEIAGSIYDTSQVMVDQAY